jgi:methyltransferase family protein
MESMRAWLARNPIARFFFRVVTVVRAPGALRKRPGESLRYLLRSRELSNYTYELANPEQIDELLSEVLAVERESVAAYREELHGDDWLRGALSDGLRTNPKRDREPRYGKRALDYCIVRLRRPRLLIELGTHDGLGAAVILRALERNAEDGDDGRLHCLDLNEEAGWLVPDPLRSRMSLRVGDIRETLGPALDEGKVDYLNSDVAPNYPDKAWTLEAVTGRAHEDLVIRDEVDEGATLARIADRDGARYGVFQEQPLRHFHSGNLIAVAAFTRV